MYLTDGRSAVTVDPEKRRRDNLVTRKDPAARIPLTSL